jgi:hypothetical protein
VTPTVLNFGTVTVGESADLTFTITNTGGGLLSGEVIETCTDFDIISGGGAYDLAGGEFVSVTVRFSPSAAGPANCTVETGTDCADVACSGTGENPPGCQVTPTDLDFGTVTAGESADRVFTIENTGGGLLTGEVAETCDHYQIISGGGAYSLGAGETRDVTVQFAPLVAGTFGCTVETGTDCANVSCTGNAEALSVYADIRPGKCPNKLRLDLPLAIPVAILGTADFSAIDIDPTTIRLTREGMAAEVAPLSWTFTDVGTPFMGTLCDCHTLGMDGFQDLRFRFDIADVVAMLDLGSLAGQGVALTITGNLSSGEEIEGEDCALVLGDLYQEDVYIGDVGFVKGTSPAAPQGTIGLAFYTRTHDHIVLEVFDVQGRIVATLVNESKSPGIYEVSWDARTENGRAVPAGVYFAMIRNSSSSATEKVTILK